MPIRLTKAVKVLLIANFAMYIIQQTADQYLGGNVTGTLGLVPTKFVNDFWVWQIVTYAFLHGPLMHLFFNLLMFAFIAGDLEAGWGTKRFVRFYFFCVVFAGLAYLCVQVFATGYLNQPLVGASGGIFGLLLAYGMIFGERTMLFMMLFPMKAKHFVWILAGLELMTLLYSGGGGFLSAVAHLSGMLAGFIYLWGSAYLKVRKRIAEAQGPRPKKSWFSKKKPSSEHLKLVINNKNELDGDDESKDPKTWH